MQLADVHHQPRAVALLRRAQASGRVHHAYLFDGPEGVGKELTARGLAAWLLCEKGDPPADDACSRCASCRLMAADNHPDFHLVHRGLHKHHPDRNVRLSKGLFLSVDLVRSFLIEPSASSPSLGRRRVFVVRDAERMNDEAQNALLKTLEEPPPRVNIVLLTASAFRLLPTIRSRCQRVPFDHLPVAFVAERLAAAGTQPREAASLATLSQGRLGAALRWRRAGLLDALPAVDGALAAEALAVSPGFARRLLEVSEGLARRLRDANGATEEEEAGAADESGEESTGRSVATDELREGVRLVLLLVASGCRDALLGGAVSAAPRLLPRELGSLAGWEADRLLDAVDGVASTERMIDRNVAPQLALERLAAVLMGEWAPALDG